MITMILFAFTTMLGNLYYVDVALVYPGFYICHHVSSQAEAGPCHRNIR